ncbi:MAG TPA: hypothetical protein VNH18_19135, partial [Bryobacteraceae bacterium]|nr:hypothetical protein [Bryobacteraceae bacterium]
MASLEGSLRVLVLYDVADAISLKDLAGMEESSTLRRGTAFRHPAPDYVGFGLPPVMERLEPITISTGEVFQLSIKYFHYGVVSIELERHFQFEWPELVVYSSLWISAGELERLTLEIARGRIARIQAALVKPYKTWLSEDYYVIQLRKALGDDGQELAADQMLATRGSELACIVRGEVEPLAAMEQSDALVGSLSYYPRDLLVVGWGAALVYDTTDGAVPTLQLLEYANSQLLEFRHYDEQLTQVLGNVYGMVERGDGLFGHWRTARRAREINAIRLEFTELAERSDNALKFLSDMFYARAWRLVSTRVGVGDYRNLVERKLRIAGELYEFMMSEFYQARSFSLELMVVAILVIELIH